MRKWLTGLLFGAGLALCLAPLAGNIRDRQRQENILSTYESAEAEIEDRELRLAWERADMYNRRLFRLREGADIAGAGETEELGEYENLLNTAGTGMMCSLEIPKIDVDLPVYHGTAPEVLSAGVGHLEGSSLPVGGNDTRCVLTGHRGLPGSRLFTRLDELREGDDLFLRVLGQMLAYEVTEIQVIRPEEVETLEIREGEDLLSLVTCTPYGINTERLVVTGRRTAYSQEIYLGIRPGLPSARELIFSAMPFLLSGAAAGILIRRSRAGKRRKEVCENHGD